MLNDIVPPDIGLRFARQFFHAFCGCRGTTTRLHYDIDMGSMLHTVIMGRPRVRLFEPEQSQALYRNPFTVRSYANIDCPDYDVFPALAHARAPELMLEPRQTRFMPCGYRREFHYVEAGVGVTLRAMSRPLTARAQRTFDFLTFSPIDLIANSVACDRWFAWKRRRSAFRAESLLKESAQSR